MNASDPLISPAAARVLAGTLEEVRRLRRRRKQVRHGAAACGSLAAIALACWPALAHHVKRAGSSVAVQTNQEMSRPAGPGDVSPEPTLAVLVMRDGGATFEQRGAADLANVQVSFSLDPVIAPLGR